MASFLEWFLLDHVAELKHDYFYDGLPKQFMEMLAYLKASTNEKTYSDYLQVACEVMEGSWNLAMASTSKLRSTSFFPLWKLNGSQPAITTFTQVTHLEEKSVD